MAGDEDKPEPGEDQPQMSITEQLKAQTELAREEEFKRVAAPPGINKQLLVVMRHGERIDEVQSKHQLGPSPALLERTVSPQSFNTGRQTVERNCQAPI